MGVMNNVQLMAMAGKLAKLQNPDLEAARANVARRRAEGEPSPFGFEPAPTEEVLELPETTEEKRAFYRHFYENDPSIALSIDIHWEIPLTRDR